MHLLNTHIGDRFLRLREVLQLVPVSKSAWYKGVEEGRYPRGVKLSERTIAWRASDIDALIKRLSECEVREATRPSLPSTARKQAHGQATSEGSKSKQLPLLPARRS